MSKYPLLQVDDRLGNGDLPIQSWEPDRARLACADLSVAGCILAPGDDLSYAGEEYRIVRTKVLQRLELPFRLAITSPSWGDGKTVSAVNLSVALALPDEANTLLIDADLRRPNVHLKTGLPAAPGLSDVLRGECSIQDAIVKVEELPRLFILPGGDNGANMSELLHSRRWHSLGSQLSKYFGHIIIDCPPVDLFADFDLIATICDSTVLIVRPGHSDRKLLAAALRRLPPKLLGVIVNAVEDSVLNPTTSHRYHDYCRRGAELTNADGKITQ